MALYNDSIAPGFTTNAGDFSNFEDIFTSGELHAPLRVPLGSVTTRADDGTEVTDGWREVVLQQLGDPFGYTLHSELAAYVTLIFAGDWTQENADATLRTQLPDGTYAYYNVRAYLPRLGEDYTHITAAYVRDLRLRFLILSNATVS